MSRSSGRSRGKLVLPYLAFMFAHLGIGHGEEATSSVDRNLSILADPQQPEGERSAVITLLQTKPASAMVLEALASVVIQPDCSESLRQQAMLAIPLIQRSGRGLVCPVSLVDGLLSANERTRDRCSELIEGFSVFSPASFPSLQKACQGSDDLVFVRLAHVFPDVERLRKLCEHENSEVRAIALRRLWSATQDVPTTVRACVQEQQINRSGEMDRLMKEEVALNKKMAQLELEDGKRRDLDAALRAVRRKLMVRIEFEVWSAELVSKQTVPWCHALATLLTNPKMQVRLVALDQLGRIAEADEEDRKMIVSAGIKDVIQEALDVANDPETISGIQSCLKKVTTSHDRRRLKKHRPTFELPGSRW